MQLFFSSKTLISTSLIGLLLTVNFSALHAQVRSSTNYQVQSDSLNVGGGLASSTNFTQESTVGEVATGRSTSTNFSLRAGYQQMQEVFLSLAGGADVVMDPALPGITGGNSNGSTTFTVITDNPAGYILTIESQTSPAMQRADLESIADYTPVGGADFAFTLDPATAEFGYSPEGVDVTSTFLDDGGACGVGSLDTAFACWAGLTTTPVEIARGVGGNQPAGATTTINFRVGISSGAAVETGVYTATTTVTALPL